MQVRSERRSAWSTLLLHCGCVLLLMWPAIANRAPFFFPDTTSYVRSADIVAFMNSGGRIATAWSDRYRAELGGKQPASEAAPSRSPTPAHIAPRPGNDIGAGNIMSGRSPYFGALLYLAYVASDFWLFLLAQAIVAYVLIRLTLRLFAVARPTATLTMVAVLAALTSLPFYVTLLLADALAGFGILAFLLLAIGRGRLRPGETAFLVAVILVSAVSHLTHIVVLLAMTATLGLIVATRRASWADSRTAVVVGMVGVAIGLASVWLTAQVVTRTFNRPPQLVPLLTSRLVEDGPGADFIHAGCDGMRFIVCRLPNGDRRNANDFLWSPDPKRGVFMPADPATRRSMSAEDGAFARAVLEADPLGVATAMVRNTVRQAVDFGNDGLNQGCFDAPDCWTSLPAGQRDRLQASLSGRRLWPNRMLDVVQYGVVVVSLAFVGIRLGRSRRATTSATADLRLWFALLLVALVVNAAVCGAVSIPQYRYQARIIWLLPFLGALLATIDFRAAGAPFGRRGPRLAGMAER